MPLSFRCFFFIYHAAVSGHGLALLGRLIVNAHVARRGCALHLEAQSLTRGTMGVTLTTMISVLLSYFNYVYYAQRYGAEVFENKKLAELALDDTASSASESSSEEETPNASSSSSSGSSDNEGLDEKEIAEKKEKRRKKRKGWSAPARCTAHPRTNAHIHSTRARRAMRIGCRKACNARLRLHCYIQHSNNACQLFFFFLSQRCFHSITFLPHC